MLRAKSHRFKVLKLIRCRGGENERIFLQIQSGSKLTAPSRMNFSKLFKIFLSLRVYPRLEQIANGHSKYEFISHI